MGCQVYTICKFIKIRFQELTLLNDSDEYSIEIENSTLVWVHKMLTNQYHLIDYSFFFPEFNFYFSVGLYVDSATCNLLLTKAACRVSNCFLTELHYIQRALVALSQEMENYRDLFSEKNSTLYLSSQVDII